MKNDASPFSLLLGIVPVRTKTHHRLGSDRSTDYQHSAKPLNLQ